jgi:hypothetical protein
MNTISMGEFVLNQKKQIPPKKQWVTFKVSTLEMQALETYCRRTQSRKANVLQETIRTLPTYISPPTNS